jgi:hypothetical protein
MSTKANGRLAPCEAAVIAAYSAARAQGCTRYDAFVRAVQAYREQVPDEPANRAGTEVARILLATARPEGDAATATLQPTEGMEYVETA